MEKKDLTGLEYATNKKDAEYDLTAALLKAVEFRTSEEAIQEVEIRRNGEYFFTVHVRPISDEEARTCRKKATKMITNPNGKKLPKIEGEFDSARFHSELIYTATTDEDKKLIWGNAKVMEKVEAMQPWETIDKLLAVGEKTSIVDLIMVISGDDEDPSPEDYAKN